MMTFGTTLYKSNGVPPWSRCYGPRWVDRLYRGIARNFKEPFRFVCLTDELYAFEEDAIEQQSLKHTNWQTTCLQLHGIKADRLCLMGLDTIVVGDITHLAEYTGELAVPRDPYRKHAPCNGVVLCPTRVDLANSSAPSDMAALEGLPLDWLDDLYPNQIISYKVNMRDIGRTRPPADARIVYFHGEPKPQTLELFPEHEWVREHWR